MNSFLSQVLQLAYDRRDTDLIWQLERLNRAETYDDRKLALDQLGDSIESLLKKDQSLSERWEAMLITLLQSNYFAHHTATVDPGSHIGADTKIWHYTHIMRSANIGANCVLGQNVYIGPKVEIGSGSKVQNNVSLYEGVRCEELVFIGPSVVFTNVINPRSAINRKEEFKPTHIGKGASIGANSTILCGLKIGAYAFIGAGSLVTSDVPAYAMYFGQPARFQYWVSAAGHRLDFKADYAVCPEMGTKYIIDGKGIIQPA